MLFAVHYECQPEHRDAVISRFLKLGTDAPPDVKVIGNWWSVTQLEGWAIIEGNDPLELGKLFHTWTDLAVNHLTPVLDASHVKAIMSR